MKKTLIIITALLLIVGCSKPINESTLLKRGELMYEANATKPFSGKVFELYDNGLKAFEGTYKDGFRHGDWTYNTEVGNSKYNVTYTVGNYNLVVFTDSLGTNYTGSPVIDEPEQDGTYLGQGRKGEYDFSIYPIVHVTFKDGKPDGLTTHWYKNGQKKIEETYNDGKNEGKYTSWYENGQKKKEETYKDGQRDGAWTQWRANGQKEYEGTYKDGKLDGLGTSWYENGQKEVEGTYKDDKKDGLWTYWYENGQKQTEETYKHDELISSKSWNKDGSIIKNVCISTDFGIMILELYPEVAPKHVESFIQHVKNGYYNGTTFHRVIPGFVIQGGDPNSRDNNRDDDGQGGHAARYFGHGDENVAASWTLPAEFNERPHITGALSMARSQENNSAGSQFFICAAPVHRLDNRYTVFGQVISGLEVIQKIVNVPRDRRDNPSDKIEMEIDICEK